VLLVVPAWYDFPRRLQQMIDVTVPDKKTAILIVDDNELVRESMQAILDEAGFLTITAPDGISALASFGKRRPDLVLLDLIMPGKDGFTVCRELRCRPDGELVPIVVLTGLDDNDSIRGAFDAGATDFICKPVNSELLVHRVHYILRASQTLKSLAENKARLTRSQQIARLASWELYPATSTFCGSQELSRLLGKDTEKVCPDSSYDAFLSAVDSPDRELIASALGMACTNKSSCCFDFRVRSNDHTIRTVRLQGQTEVTASGRLNRLVGTIQDITEMRQVEDQLKMLKEAVDCLPIGLTLIGLDGKIIYSNPAEAEMHGYKVEELIGREARQFAPESSSRPFSREKLNDLGMWRRESVNIRKNGEEFPVQLISIAVRDTAGRTLGVVTACEDISSRKQAENRINYLAYYDTLTGLPNRGMFLDRLHHALAMAHREKNQVSLLFIDLDNFKDINDTKGHDFGDKLLQVVAKRLAATMRESDTLARLGGDEFVLVLNSVERQEAAADAAQRILAAFAAPFPLESQLVRCNASIGIATYPDDGQDADSLVKCADTAMYFAKEKGKGHFRFFSSELNSRIMHRVAMENSLRDGLQKQEFLLHYQPKWDLKRSRITGVEVLLRWQSAEFGFMLPGEFISLLENTGLIISIGQWVLRTACMQCKKWSAAGHSDLQVAVNISGQQLRQPDFVEMVEKIIVETGIEPRLLELEFTESIVMENAEETVHTLNTLKSMGIQLSIDDFGTGFSSLSYLKNFAIDRIKIDRAFVVDVLRSRVDAAIVEGIIAMGHNLNLKVLAEGVEDAEQLFFLTAHGCDEVQGFYVALPMSAEDLNELLRTPTGPVQTISEPVFPEGPVESSRFTRALSI
jgi:diguanylate cyclase (GGDEF)-like protein/PAS domain S-box-containing protein